MKNHLLFFYGTDCPHCVLMEALLDKLKFETGCEVERIEVWGNEENTKMMEDIDKGSCGGVPFFANTKTGKNLCGEVTFKEIKNWAEDK